MPPTVRSFAENEWPDYKDLRLAALAESPEAFGSTFAQESQRADAEWARRLAAGVHSGWDFPALAEIESLPIGLAWGRIEGSNPALANLYQVWVRPRYRRLGAGRLLLEAVIAWAIDRRAECLELGVACGDTPATRLYSRIGFVPVGQPEPLRPGAALLSQKMRLPLTMGAA